VALDDEHNWSDLYVSQAHLDRRLRLLQKSGFEVLPLNDALLALRSGALPQKAIAITFDDGAADFFLQALPLLKSHHVPATLYLTTHYVEHQLPVFDTVLSYLMWKGQGRQAHLPLLQGRTTIPSDGPARRALHAAIRLQVRATPSLDSQAKHELLALVARDVSLDFDAFVASRKLMLMRPDEVRSLPRELIDLQLHTHRHRTPRDRDGFMREVRDNRAAFSRIGLDGNRPTHFCYPSGDYIAEYREWLAAEGIVSATTCDTGIASAQDDPFFLPRFIDSEQIPEEVFFGWVTGLAAWLPHRRRG
jgi:peptidoglycan/xylan/chitin deacetylase (PgdA/CDA1 family)